jgi:hypothetical protein
MTGLLPCQVIEETTYWEDAMDILIGAIELLRTIVGLGCKTASHGHRYLEILKEKGHLPF